MNCHKEKTPMTNDQKKWVHWRIVGEQQELQQLEAGQWPEWAKHTERTGPPTLDVRRKCADWCLKAVLFALLPTLPKALRTTVQACFDLRERIWSTEYMNAYFQAQKETSPRSLQAPDSF
jgi:hypothetical protein